MYKIRKIVFHEHPVLKNLSLNFCDSEGKCIDTIIFAGENGTGKSTIINSIYTLKVAPLQILKFPVVLPHKFLDAEKFNLRFSDASEITEIADKLRWYRYQKGLRQRDAADYAGIDRSTYIHYEEAGRDFYPKEHMEKLAELFEVPLEDMLDDYNLFLLRGQGAQIKAIRQQLGLTQKAYAAQLGVPLQKFKRWEQDTVQIFKSTWEKYFKQT